MTTTHTQDRRRSERVTIRGPLVLEAPDGAQVAALRNLSLAGLSCTTATAFPELSRIKVTLDLAAADPATSGPVRIEVWGAVVRCVPVRHGTGKRRFELGLYFTDLTDAERVALTDLIKSRLT